LKLVEGVTWMASADSGHGVVVDGAPSIGGQDLGFRPMELVLAGLGSCSGMDVMSILRKARQDVTDCVIDVEAERAESVPKVFTRIHVRYTVTGRGLKPAVVKRAVELSAETYCSVSRMLQASAEITFDHEIVDA